MASQATAGAGQAPVRNGDSAHKARWWAAAIAGVLLLVAVGSYGSSYYLSPIAERTRDPIHAQLRPSGAIALNLGVVAALMFLFIYLYLVRKRWSRMRNLGKTKRWLDFHILFGLLAPLLITLHSSFKFNGLAGMAFWIMWAVAMSGVVGRYFYSAIPRHLNAAEMSMKDAELSRNDLSGRLQERGVFSGEEVEAICHVPDAAVEKEMSLARGLLTMLWLDAVRPFQIARLRRRMLSPLRVLLSAGGLLPLGDAEFEEGVTLLRKQAWLSTKIVFLGKSQRVFHLWHVVHRPFSYSFAVLVVVHVAFVLMMGYH